MFPRRTYRDLKVDKLVGESRHRVVEAEAVLACDIRSEDVVALALLLAVKNHLLLPMLLAWSVHRVVDYSSS